MPFLRPDLDELRERIKDDLANRLIGANPRLRVNNLRVMAEVEAGIAHLLYGRLEWSFRQLFPDTAETEFLDRWASIWGVRRSPATRASGPCLSIAEPGAFIDAGDLLQLEGGNIRFRVRLGVPEQGGRVSFTAECTEYGAIGNVPAGTVLRWTTTRQGIAPIATVQPPDIGGGAPEDTDAQLLAALLRRIQAPPHGGAAHDYVNWMHEISGVTRAWCYPLERGLGTVALRFMMDDVRGPDGIPTAGDCQRMWDHLDLVRPVTADLGPAFSLDLPPPFPPGSTWGFGYIFPPFPVAAAVQIGELSPDTPDIRREIELELRDMIRHETAPGARVLREQYVMAIGNTPGVSRFRLLQPAVDVTVQHGEIVTLGPLSFV